MWRNIVLAVLVGASVVCLQGGVIASPPQEPHAPVAFVKPLPGAKTYTLSRIEGQAVVAPVSQIREVGGVGGLGLALFPDKGGDPVASVTTDQQGLFRFEDIAPGKYVLVAALSVMHEIGIPGQGRAGAGM